MSRPMREISIFRPCDHPTPPAPQRQTRLGGASENPHRFAVRRSHPGAFGSSASVFLRGTSGPPASPTGLRGGSLPAILGCHGRAAAPSARRSFLLVDVLTVRVYHSQSTPLPSGSGRTLLRLMAGSVLIRDSGSTNGPVFDPKGDLVAVKVGAEYRIIEDDFIDFTTRNKTKQKRQGVHTKGTTPIISPCRGKHINPGNRNTLSLPTRQYLRGAVTPAGMIPQ